MRDTTITIYEIIQEAELKYIILWGNEGYKQILDEWISNLESLISKGKEHGDNLTVEDAIHISLNILKEEFKQLNIWDKDLILISGFKIAEKINKPFSEELVKAICVNFLDIIEKLKENKSKGIAQWNQQ